jgi:hypothetical protein
VATTNIDNFIAELTVVQQSIEVDLAAYNNLVAYAVLPKDIFDIVQEANTNKSNNVNLVTSLLISLAKLKASGYPYPDIPIITAEQKATAKANVTSLSLQLNKIINKL